jgi:hypothetical protein
MLDVRLLADDEFPLSETAAEGVFFATLAHVIGEMVNTSIAHEERQYQA